MRITNLFIDYLSNDRTIVENLSGTTDEYTGIRYPSIAKRVAPEGTKLPYMVVRKESAIREGAHIDRATFKFEVFADNNEEAVEIVIARAAQLLNNVKIMPWGLSCYYANEYDIPVSDQSLTAKGVEIIARVPRPELYISEHDSVTQDIYIQVIG